MARIEHGIDELEYGALIGGRKLFDAGGDLLQLDQRPSIARAPTYDGTTAGAPLAVVARTYAYDALGRKTQELTGSNVVEMPTYDAASNVLGGTRQSWGMQIQYDQLNRPVRQLRGGTDTLATFAYDAAGNMSVANNKNSRIWRSYYPNCSRWIRSTSRATPLAPALDIPTS